MGMTADFFCRTCLKYLVKSLLLKQPIPAETLIALKVQLLNFKRRSLKAIAAVTIEYLKTSYVAVIILSAFWRSVLFSISMNINFQKHQTCQSSTLRRPSARISNRQKRIISYIYDLWRSVLWRNEPWPLTNYSAIIMSTYGRTLLSIN